MKPIRVNLLARMVLAFFIRLTFKPQTFSLGCQAEKSESVLICMPTDVDRFAMARDLLLDFIDIFQPREIHVLLPFLGAGGYLSECPDYRVVGVQREDLNLFSLPRKGFIRKLTELEFGMSLDLDLEDGFFSRYLCLKCRIPLRIGPKRKGAFPLYNVQLAPARNQLGSREAYEGMAQTMRWLFSTGNRAAPSVA